MREYEPSTLPLWIMPQAASNRLEYDLQTPWHLLVSGSYIFPGAVTEGKMGFITADVEYIDQYQLVNTVSRSTKMEIR